MGNNSSKHTKSKVSITDEELNKIIEELKRKEGKVYEELINKSSSSSIGDIFLITEQQKMKIKNHMCKICEKMNCSGHQDETLSPTSEFSEEKNNNQQGGDYDESMDDTYDSEDEEDEDVYDTERLAEQIHNAYYENERTRNARVFNTEEQEIMNMNNISKNKKYIR